MQIMAQKVDELLDGDHCSASRAGATNCQHRHSQLRREMSAIIPLHGLLTVGRWAWEYLKQHSFLFFFLRTHLRTEKVRTTTWTASPDINTNACIKSTYGNSLTFYEDDFLELELSFFFFSGVRIQCTKKKTWGFCSLVMFPTVPCHSNALSFLLSLLRLRRGY